MAGRRRRSRTMLVITTSMMTESHHRQNTEGTDTADHPLRRRDLLRKKRFMSKDRDFAWPKAIVPFDFNLPNNSTGMSDCVPVCLSLCLRLCLFIPPLFQPACLPACLYLPVSVIVCPSVRLCIVLSVSQPACPFLSVSRYVCLSVCLPGYCPSVCLHVSLRVCPSVCSVCPRVCFSDVCPPVRMLTANCTMYVISSGCVLPGVYHVIRVCVTRRTSYRSGVYYPMYVLLPRRTCVPVYVTSSRCLLPPCTSCRPGIYYSHVRYVVQVFITLCMSCHRVCIVQVCVTRCKSCCPGVYYPMDVILSRCACVAMYVMLSRCLLPDVRHVVQVCIIRCTL